MNGAEGFSDLVWILPGCASEAGPTRVHDTGLSNRFRPHQTDQIRQPTQPVADHHAPVCNPTVLQLDEDLRPIFGSLSTVAGPQAQNVPIAIDGDCQRDANRPVRDLPVTDFDMDTVDEDHGPSCLATGRVQGPILPFGHALDHPVGDRRDRGLEHLRPIHLRQVRADIPVGEPAGRQRQHHLINASLVWSNGDGINLFLLWVNDDAAPGP